MQYKTHPIIHSPHEYEIVYLGYEISIHDYKNSYIDIHFKKGEALIKLRFNQPQGLEIEKGFCGYVSGMEILDIRDRQLDGIGVEVRNFEQDAGITFLARDVQELNA